MIVRAGDTSLHPGWLPATGRRSWDLVVSYFGDDPNRYRSDDVIRTDAKGPKWKGLYRVLAESSDLLDHYDYIWLPDDDLECDPSAIERLFESMRQYDLLLGQPALSARSYFSWCITLQNPMTRIRYVNFIETMAPCFHSSLLLKCLPLLDGQIGGWGLDWVWPKYAGSVPDRVAVIDDAAVTHTRPFGGPNYRFFADAGFSPLEEANRNRRTHDINETCTRIDSMITRGGVKLSGTNRVGRAVIRAGYLLTIGTAYVRRKPQRWELHARLRDHLANPTEIADHPGLFDPISRDREIEQPAPPGMESH